MSRLTRLTDLHQIKVRDESFDFFRPKDKINDKIKAVQNSLWKFWAGPFTSRTYTYFHLHQLHVFLIVDMIIGSLKKKQIFSSVVCGVDDVEDIGFT